VRIFDPVVIDVSGFDAFLFDLDGVITRTAGLHASAWKKLFDEYLGAQAARTGAPFVPFDIVADYRAHVDGKPRHAGIVKTAVVSSSRNTVAILRVARLREPSPAACGSASSSWERVQAILGAGRRVGDEYG
jgi:beta-phosphoglucomutase-like phosphatase (HAD superfamily)